MSQLFVGLSVQPGVDVTAGPTSTATSDVTAGPTSTAASDVTAGPTSTAACHGRRDSGRVTAGPTSTAACHGRRDSGRVFNDRRPRLRVDARSHIWWKLICCHRRHTTTEQKRTKSLSAVFLLRDAAYVVMQCLSVHPPRSCILSKRINISFTIR